MAKWRVIGITALMVLCAVFLVFGDEEPNITVEITAPTTTQALDIGDTITLRVTNFPTSRPEDGIVRITARRDGHRDWKPLFEGRGDGWVALRPGENFQWTDEERGKAEITLLWETDVAGELLFPAGNYQIRARVWIRGRSSDWADEIAVTIGDIQPPRGAKIVEPSPGTELRLNQVVSVKVSTWGLTPPLDVSLEVGRVDSPDDYRVIAQFPLVQLDHEESFTLSWAVSELAPRDYDIRVVVNDEDGSVTSEPVHVTIIPPPDDPPGRISITVNGDVLAEFPTEIQQLIRFGIERHPEDLVLQSFEWDFGDGRSSNLPSAEHAYRAESRYTVSLVAWSEPGHTGIRYEAERVTIHVKPIVYVTATRAISGFPSIEKDEMTILPGFSLTVRVEIEIHHEVHAVTLREEIPANWTLSDSTPLLAHNEGVEIIMSGPTITDARKPANWEWVIIGEPLLPGQKIFVVYTLQAPPDARPGSVSLTGEINVGATAGLVGRKAVGGQPEFRLVSSLPIVVVIAHMQPDQTIAPRAFTAPTISRDQLEIAKSLWQNNLPVPHTTPPDAAGKTISMETFLKLIVYYNENIPITFYCLECFYHRRHCHECPAL